MLARVDAPFSIGDPQQVYEAMSATSRPFMNRPKPRILMLKGPKMGDAYRQEYPLGKIGKLEGMGAVIAVQARVTVPHGVFEDCVGIRNWSPIEESESKHKYFCSGLGSLVLEEKGPEAERLELVSVSAN
jgi:hypothetical protein